VREQDFRAGYNNLPFVVAGEMTMARVKLAIATVILLAFVGTAWSNTIIGTGYSCGRWLQERALPQHGMRAQAEAWIAGYVSGINVAAGSGDLLRDLDAEAVYAWTVNYCRTSPLDPLNDAANALIFELRKRKSTTPR
jgi:hypothetical protein